MQRYPLFSSADEPYDPEPRPEMTSPNQFATEMATVAQTVMRHKEQIRLVAPERWRTVSQLECLASSLPHVLRTEFGIDMASMAWIKMYELLQSIHFPSSSSRVRTMHLCEAPGAFVSSLIHYINRLRWIGEIPGDFVHEWFASSLRADKALQRLHGNSFLDDTANHWIYGKDGTGDLLNPSVIQDIWVQVGSQTCDLVTGDGGVDFDSHPEQQETMALALIHAQVVAALGCLKIGGTLVLKIFSCFHAETAVLLALLNSLFVTSHLTKPVASKPCNSEVYFVGEGFTGIAAATLKSLLHRTAGLGSHWNQNFAEKLFIAECNLAQNQSFHLATALEHAFLPVRLPSCTHEQRAWAEQFLHHR